MSLLDFLSTVSEDLEQSKISYEQKADNWWESLPTEQRELAFYSVVKRIYEGELKQQGSYRYVLYDVFGFDPSMYGVGMNCGFMALHNAIKTAAEEQIIHEYYEAKQKQVKTCTNKVTGSCPLPNIQCQYPQCEQA